MKNLNIKNLVKISLIVFLTFSFNNAGQSAMIIPNAVAEEIKMYGYQPSEQGFFDAAKKGDVRVLNLFTEANAYVNMKDSQGRTPVFYAAMAGQEKAVRFLLLYGADINARDENLKSPLMAAIEKKSFSTAKLLIDMGASVKVSDENGYTPLHYAVLNNQKELVSVITNKLCDVDATDNEGNSPLFYSVGKSKDIMNTLLRAGADINGTNSDGKTALHQAVIKKNIESVKFLLENGANVNIKDINGNNPINYAVQGQPVYILLLEAGSKI